MSKFRDDESVRVSNPGSFWFGQVGRVHRSYETRFGKKTVVIFDPAPCVSFEEWMLTLAEPSVTDVLDQMDKESAPTSKGMDEREIDGEYVPGLNRRAKTLRTAEELINGDRAKAYGDPQTNFGRIANLWNAQFGDKLRTAFTAGDVALALTHLKLSRLANTPDHADSFIDACGYLALGAELADGL